MVLLFLFILLPHCLPPISYSRCPALSRESSVCSAGGRAAASCPPAMPGKNIHLIIFYLFVVTFIYDTNTGHLSPVSAQDIVLLVMNKGGRVLSYLEADIDHEQTHYYLKTPNVVSTECCESPRGRRR